MGRGEPSGRSVKFSHNSRSPPPLHSQHKTSAFSPAHQMQAEFSAAAFGSVETAPEGEEVAFF